jgi:hypothetical protein
MQAMFGARDAAHLNQIIQNAQREAERLNNIRMGVPGVVEPREWTTAEQQRAAELWYGDQAIEKIREKSNLLEPDPPEDYTDDKYWV